MTPIGLPLVGWNAVVSASAVAVPLALRARMVRGALLDTAVRN